MSVATAEKGVTNAIETSRDRLAESKAAFGHVYFYYGFKVAGCLFMYICLSISDLIRVCRVIVR